MSLWTPGGEHEVPREPTPSTGTAGGVPVDAEVADALAAMSPEERAQAEQVLAEMAQAREEIARTPAAVVIANHAMGLYELAAIHLSQQPPNLEEAQLAVDAVAALTGALRGRLGESEATLTQALTSLQMAFVELSRRRDEAAAAASGPAAAEDPGGEVGADDAGGSEPEGGA